MIKKGLQYTLLASAISVAGAAAAFASAPVIGNIQDVIIGDLEDNIGTDNNLFVYNNAFGLDTNVTDADTPASQLIWHFAEADSPVGGNVGATTQVLTINGRNPIRKGDTAIAGLETVSSQTLNATSANELRSAGTSASLRNILYSPAGNNPSPLVRTGSATVVNSLATTGLQVNLYVSDGTNWNRRSIIVRTVDQTSDSLTSSQPIPTTLYDNTFESPAPFDSLANNAGGGALGTPPANTTAAEATVAGTGDIRVVVKSQDPSNDRFRIYGWGTGSGLISYGQVGAGNYVRGKFSVYRGNQTAANQTPGMRMRLNIRFAQGSLITLLVGNQNFFNELAPTTNAATPSVYNVDFDPHEVPYLTSNAANTAAGETSTIGGIRAGFECWSVNGNSAQQGFLALTQLQIQTYPKPDSTKVLLKKYTTANSDFINRTGDGTGNIVAKIERQVAGVGTGGGIFPTIQGANAALDPTSVLGASGNTASTQLVPSNQIGVAGADIFRSFADQVATLKTGRARVGVDTVYQIRYHATATINTNIQTAVRFRANTLQFTWGGNFEIGGSQNAGSQSNTIAQQTLPGVGNQLASEYRDAGDTTGGWYVNLYTSPIQRAIRSDVAGFQSAPLSTLFPLISAQDPTGVDTNPGPTNNATTRRDIAAGWDLLDTTSGGTNAATEVGQITVDGVEIYEYTVAN